MHTEWVSIVSDVRKVDSTFCKVLNHIFKVCINLKKLNIYIKPFFGYENDSASALKHIT